MGSGQVITVICLLVAAQIVIFFIFSKVVLGKIRKYKNAPQIEDREVKIFRLYKEIEDMLDGFEDYVREVHEENERQRAEIEEISRQAKAVYTQLVDRPPRYDAYTSPYAPPPSSLAEPPPVAQESVEKSVPQKVVRPVKANKNSRISQKDRDELDKLSSKSVKVRFLMSRGLSLDEVARELNIGKGEVRLIADLDKT